MMTHRIMLITLAAGLFGPAPAQAPDTLTDQSQMFNGAHSPVSASHPVAFKGHDD